MDRAERDVLVAAPVTAGEVRVQHLVVVGAGRLRSEIRRRRVVGIRRRRHGRRGRVVVGVLRARIGVMRDIRQERRVEVAHVRRNRYRAREVALDETAFGHVLGQTTSRAGNEVAVRVGRDHRDVGHVPVDQEQSELRCCLELGRLPAPDSVPPVRRVEIGLAGGKASEQLAGRDRMLGRVELVLTQEHLVRSVGRVSLTLIDPRRVGVVRVLHIVCRLIAACRDIQRGACAHSHRRRRAVLQHAVGTGLVLCPREHHEALARGNLVTGSGLAVGAERDERIVGTQRYEHGAAALDGLVDAVIEELAEEREERVVRRREADVRRHVRNEERLVRRHAARGIGHDGRDRVGIGIRRACDDAVVALRAYRERRRLYSGRVGRRLVDDQVRDQARLRVEHEALLLRIRRTRNRAATRAEEISRAAFGCAEDGGRQPRERYVRGREVLATLEQVVARSIDRAQAVGGEPVWNLIRPGPDERLAVIRVSERTGVDRCPRVGVSLIGARVALGDLDLLENERQVGGRYREPLADRPWRGTRYVAVPARGHGGRSEADGSGQEAVHHRPHDALPARSPDQCRFRPREAAAYETTSVHCNPPQELPNGVARPPSRRPATATIRPRTFRNLLISLEKSAARDLAGRARRS